VALARDARVAEVVSPADNEGELTTLGFVSPAGDHVGYTAFGTFAGAQQTGTAQAYAARRTADGWVTDHVDAIGGGTVLAFADSGARAVWQTVASLDAEDILTFSNDLFLREGSGPITRLSYGPLRKIGVSANFAGASSDLSTILFESPVALAPPDDQRLSGVGFGLYAWRDGTLSNITVPDVNATKRGVVVGGGAFRRGRNPVTADAQRMVLTSPAATDANNRARLWILDGAGPARPLTGPPAADERYDAGSADLRTVVLSTKDALTPDDTDGGQIDLYAADTAADPPVITRISGGDGTTCSLAGLTGCEARTVLVSADGSSVVFVSPEVLAPGATANGANLYVRRGATTVLAATLPATDAPVTSTDPARDARISADGTRLAFLTAKALTADDTDTAVDLYLFDAVAGRLTRLSQGPAGGNSGDAVLFFASRPAYGLSNLGVPPRSLSADGACAFFETAEALVPGDTSGVTDVYASCDGTTTLVSAGTGADDSHFVNNSADGDDAFIITTDALSVADLDGGPSIYDLRVGGRAARLPAPPCTGDACQGPATPAPERPAIGTFGAASESAGSLSSSGLVVRTPDRTRRQKAARTGKLDMTVEVPSGGSLTLSATSRRYGKAKTTKKKARAAKVAAFTGKKTAGAASTVKLTLTLPAALRKALKSGPQFLTVRGRLVGAGVDATDSAGFVLSLGRKR
jgi:hypothetical protein